jgi:hypothetical protein
MIRRMVAFGTGCLAAAVALAVPRATTAGSPSTTTAAPTTTLAPTTTTGPTTTAVPTTTAAPTTTTSPAPTSAELLAAKVGWSQFVAANFATPNAVLDPCPLAPVETMAAVVSAHGLVPSARPYGVALYRDNVGAGIIGIVCGVDLAASADPAGSTGFAVEVTLLDGQAVFPQYVARVESPDTPIVRSAALGGETAARCRNEPNVCVASWHRDGVVVSVRLDGPRTDASLDQTHRVLLAVVPTVLANLGTVAGRR